MNSQKNSAAVQRCGPTDLRWACMREIYASAPTAASPPRVRANGRAFGSAEERYLFTLGWAPTPAPASTKARPDRTPLMPLQAFVIR